MSARRLAALGALAIAQLGVVLAGVVEHERTLATGEVWRFRTAPVDPYDVFRGRYVALGFQATEGQFPLPAGTVSGDRLWAVLATDADGFARIDRLEAEPPAGVPVVAVRATWVPVPTGVVAVPLQGPVTLPFTTYWMPGDLAPRAEAAVRDASRPGEHRAWVTVRVRGTHAALEELWVDGRTIREWIAETAP